MDKKVSAHKIWHSWFLSSYVLIKLVFFYTLVQLDTFLNKNGDSKSQIGKLHAFREFLIEIQDGGFQPKSRKYFQIICATSVFPFGLLVKKWTGRGFLKSWTEKTDWCELWSCKFFGKHVYGMGSFDRFASEDLKIELLWPLANSLCIKLCGVDQIRYFDLVSPLYPNFQ